MRGGVFHGSGCLLKHFRRKILKGRVFPWEWVDTEAFWEKSIRREGFAWEWVDTEGCEGGRGLLGRGRFLKHFRGGVYMGVGH